MLEQALFAYFHYIALFVTIAALILELYLYRPVVGVELAKTLGRLDMVYGLGSILVVSTGFARALWFAKGWEFYQFNPLFWSKVTLFVVWGLLSLPPTFHFLSWRKLAARGEAPLVSPQTYLKIRLCMSGQLALVFIIPILAVLMARGVGIR